LSVAGHFKLRDPFFEFKVASCRQTHGVYQRNREPTGNGTHVGCLTAHRKWRREVL